MLVYLDNGENVKAHPNENFGRELLELFTMGVGHYTEHDVREAARVVHRLDQRRPDVQVRRRTARFWPEDVPRPDGRLQRRGHHQGDPRSAGHGRVHGWEDLPVLRARGSIRAGEGRSRPHVSGERISVEAVAQTNLSVKGLLQLSVERDSDQEPRAPRRVDIQEDGPSRGADNPRLRSHDGRARPVALRPAECCGLGRRPYLDDAGDSAPTWKLDARRAVSRREDRSVRRTGRCPRRTRGSGSA